MNHRMLMTDHNSIAFPKSMGVYDRFLYFIDSRYDHLVRVNAEDGSNMEKIIDNDADLKSLRVFSKKSSEFSRDYRRAKGAEFDKSKFKKIPTFQT